MSELLIHQEAQAALTTRRPEVIAMLRARLGLSKASSDAALLCNALEVAIRELAESDHRLSEVDMVLKAMTRTLRGAADQTTQLREVVQKGGSYKNVSAREEEG